MGRPTTSTCCPFRCRAEAGYAGRPVRRRRAPVNPDPAAADFDSEKALQEHIRAERIRFVLIQSALPIVFSPLAGAVLAVTLWQAVEAWRLLVFVAGLVAIAVQRVVMTRRFPDPPPTGRALRGW